MSSLKMTASKDKGKKRSELLNEAARVFNRNGISQTSLRLIAKNVGISRSALYYYVDDQQDLVYQCYSRSCTLLAELLEISVETNSNALDIIDDFITSAFDDNRPEIASLSDIAFLRKEQHAIVFGLYKELRNSLAKVITDGISKNELRQCDSRIVASIILGTIAWVPICMRWDPEIGSSDAICENLRETFRYGIASERAETKSFDQFDISSFVINSGNVFDAHTQTRVRRETLILVASWLFNQKGIESTSLDEIAAEVGVTKKVIYHNIGGKDILVTECYRRAFRFFSFVADCAESCHGSRIDSICMSLTTLAAASLRRDIAPLAPMAAHESWSEEDGKDLYKLVDKLIEKAMTLFKGGVEEGSVRCLGIHSMLMLRPGFYEWLPRWGNSLSDIELANAPSELTNIYRLGLAPLDS